MSRRLATLALAAALAAAAASPARAATFVVNSVASEPDGMPGDGRCVTAEDECTLLAAAQEAAAAGGPDVVAFAIPGGGVPTVVLPDGGITFTQVTVDGTTQPDGGRVILEGSGVGFHPCLTLQQASLLRGIEVRNCPAAGVRALGAGNAIEESVVTASRGVGVLAVGPTRITRNAIFGNGTLGIDNAPFTIAEGPTPNDEPDVDGIQNGPVFVSAGEDAGEVVVTWELRSTPNVTFTLEVFGNEACHPSSFGEGRLFLLAVPLAVQANGVGQVTTRFPVDTFPVEFPTLTATATSPGGATSEFSDCVDTTTIEEPTTTTTTSPDTTTTTDPGATTTTTTTTTSSTTTSTLAPLCVRDPNGLGIDGAGHPHISDRAEGAVIALDLAAQKKFVSHRGLRNPADVDLNGCAIYVAERHDYKAFNVGVTGILKNAAGEPVPNARVALQTTDGRRGQATTTGAGGEFQVAGDIFRCRPGRVAYLHVQTMGSETERPRATTLPIVLDPGTNAKPLSETLLEVTLPALP